MVIRTYVKSWSGGHHVLCHHKTNCSTVCLSLALRTGNRLCCVQLAKEEDRMHTHAHTHACTHTRTHAHTHTHFTSSQPPSEHMGGGELGTCSAFQQQTQPPYHVPTGCGMVCLTTHNTEQHPGGYCLEAGVRVTMVTGVTHIALPTLCQDFPAKWMPPIQSIAALGN